MLTSPSALRSHGNSDQLCQWCVMNITVGIYVLHILINYIYAM